MDIKLCKITTLPIVLVDIVIEYINLCDIQYSRNRIKKFEKIKSYVDKLLDLFKIASQKYKKQWISNLKCGLNIEGLEGFETLYSKILNKLNTSKVKHLFKEKTDANILTDLLSNRILMEYNILLMFSYGD